MTRSAQKIFERSTLDKILEGLGALPDREPEVGEAPDFLVMISKRQIGIEITSYDSGEIIESHARRQVESEWDKLKQASDAFRSARPALANINAIFYFYGSVPPQRRHTDFLNEIAVFIEAHRDGLTGVDTDYDHSQFSTPLMMNHLQTLCLRLCPYAEWKTNLDTGFVATATSSRIPEIASRKSAKKFRPADELWIAIECTTNISGTLLPLDESDLESLSTHLADYQFERVFLVTFIGLYEWKRDDGWRKLNGKPE